MTSGPRFSRPQDTGAAHKQVDQREESQSTVSSPRHYAETDVIGGKYRLLSLLGEGGMGAVWRARNTVLEVDVAIKLIRHGLGSVEASERLLQEARAAARLEHPSIIKILDFGSTDEGDPFIVMELLRGEPLGVFLDRKGRLSAVEAVRTLLPVANAICAAHAKGVVHRDLKPDNVFLTENDANAIVPKVVDFGIAKVRDEGIAYRSLTQAGAILGSPDYMCPEQARGRADVDEKADVWALSVMLYECLTGKRPFVGDNYNALIAAILEDVPQPITALAAGDEALWETLRLGLSKAPRDRPTMRTLGERLALWASHAGADSDVSGVSLASWLATARRSSADGEAARARDATTPPPSRRAEVATRSGDAAESSPTSQTTTHPVASTRSTPAPKPRSGLRVGIAAAVVMAVVATAWWSLRSTGAAARGDASPSVTASPTTGAAAATASPPDESAALPPSASTGTSTADPLPTSAPDQTGSAHDRAQHREPGPSSRPHTGKPAPHPATKGPTDLTVPARPGF
jgi:serine/threonine-protein kinase